MRLTYQNAPAAAAFEVYLDATPQGPLSKQMISWGERSQRYDFDEPYSAFDLSTYGTANEIFLHKEGASTTPLVNVGELYRRAVVKAD